MEINANCQNSEPGWGCGVYPVHGWVYSTGVRHGGCKTYTNFNDRMHAVFHILLLFGCLVAAMWCVPSDTCSKFVKLSVAIKIFAVVSDYEGAGGGCSFYFIFLLVFVFVYFFLVVSRVWHSRK